MCVCVCILWSHPSLINILILRTYCSTCISVVFVCSIATAVSVPSSCPRYAISRVVSACVVQFYLHSILPPTAPPSWVRDNQRSQCHCCLERFSFFKRKHHCRNCGEVSIICIKVIVEYKYSVTCLVSTNLHGTY